LEAAAQDETAGIFLDKDVAFPEGTPDLLADDNSTKGGGDHRIALQVAELVGEPTTDVGCDVCVLEEQRTLEELATVQARPQNEMPVQERASPAEEREKVLAH
jgi:hypothetical protein